jgi:hypothetical protein
MTVVEVSEKSGVDRFPAEGPAGDEAGRREVQPGRHREEPAEVRRQPVRGNALGGQAQVTTDSAQSAPDEPALPH